MIESRDHCRSCTDAQMANPKLTGVTSRQAPTSEGSRHRGKRRGASSASTDQVSPSVVMNVIESRITAANNMLVVANTTQLDSASLSIPGDRTPSHGSASLTMNNA